MVRKVIWTKKAITERKEILSYWIRRTQSKTYSLKLNNLILQTIENIQAQPYTGRKTDLKNIRVKLARDYLIFYELKEEIILILTIWDSRRNPDDQILH